LTVEVCYLPKQV